ncbi:Phosphatidylglycerol/phosphatidylinositol transfer protein [Friedmanniomyces endolithicus]|nr:Phosphatidylglycerol/phosphatidylinositol transfer protein [Friedmanniomyces endolithicus]KAK1816537.1 Phosphatidylglycerol/phosphatidylinositol transfer protein [Friedmanniomyces endolithicus]
MKFLTFATTALLSATHVAARSSLFGTNTDISPNVDGSLSVPGDNPLQHCQDPKDDILTIESVDLSPNPPKAGSTLSVSASGILHKDVEAGAQIHLQVKYGLITIIRQTADLCDTVGKVDLECPLHKDKETKLAKDVDLPKEIPPGKYTVVADVVSKAGDTITCLTASVEFKRGASGAMEVVWKQGL